MLFTQPRTYHPCIWCSVKSLSCIPLFVMPRTVACQNPLSMGFSRQKYWSGLPLPSPECIWLTNVFEPLIPQTFLFWVTPCWMPLSTFLFPLTRHLFLCGTYGTFTSESFVNFLWNFLWNLSSSDQGLTILIFTLSMCLVWYTGISGWGK